MKVLIITGGNIDDDFAFSFLKKNKYNLIFIFSQRVSPHSSRLGINYLRRKKRNLL